MAFDATVSNPSREAIGDPRLGLVITGDNTGTRGVAASQVRLSFADRATNGQFRTVALRGGTAGGGAITGVVAFNKTNFPAGGSEVVHFKVSVGAAAVDSQVTGAPLTAQIDLDQLNGADGSLSTFDSQAGDVPVQSNTIITGSRPGGLTANSGSTLLLNAQVGGAIVVKPGASIEIENSTVNGDVTATDLGALVLCGTSVGGSVNVSSARGFVLVGDRTGHGCDTNTIGGNLVLNGNMHGVVAVGNVVRGQVIASGNAGRGPLPGDTKPKISANTP